MRPLRRTIHLFALLAHVFAATLGLTHTHSPMPSFGEPQLVAPEGDGHGAGESGACQICAGLHIAGKALLPASHGAHHVPVAGPVPVARQAAPGAAVHRLGFHPRAPPLA